MNKSHPSSINCASTAKPSVVVVTGGGSQTALCLREVWEDVWQTVSEAPAPRLHLLSRQSCDITDPASISGALKPFIAQREQFDKLLIVNTAAYTAVDAAEDYPDEAYSGNVKGVRNLTEVALKHGMALIHLSSDFVFDGAKCTAYREGDAPHPLSVYGRTKLEGEGELAPLNAKGQGLVLRTSWLYSAYGNNFLKTIYRLLREGRSLRVVEDQIGSPTYAIDLVRFVIVAIARFFEEARFPVPIIHFSAHGIASWYDFAVAIKEFTSVAPSITPVTTAEYGAKASRPAFSLLDKSLLQRVYGITPDHWKEGVRRCLEKLTTTGQQEQ